MCDHSAHHPTTPARHGSRLEHGTAHADDHRRWSRRDFLSGMGLAAAGGAVVIGGTPVRAFSQSPLLAHLARLETNRVLVLVQLGGGNDGLNTIVPKTNDLYYNNRPTIAIAANETLPLSADLGFHPSFDALTPVYNDGDMAVLQNVGYPDPSLSHFTGTDNWLSAVPGAIPETGWLGRYLSEAFPDFDDDPPAYPLAVQMGGTSATLFQGPTSNLGMSLASPELFERIAEEGIVFSLDGLPSTTYGEEMRFVRTIANDSFQYASAIQTASESGQNDVEYPGGNPLTPNLSIVARLIKGQLGARIYHVSISGFDTHANQPGRHAQLIRNLSTAVKAFLDDLGPDQGKDVLIMTFSEFGRRVEQNGSNGTDHGTAAPLFLFSDGVEGGLYGDAPDLVNLDQNANLRFDIDFRTVYATVLQDWFGLAPTTVEDVLGGSFGTLGFVTDPATPTANEDPDAVPATFTLHQNYPNPFNPQTTISYALDQPERVTLRIYDVQGRLVQTLLDRRQAAGTHELLFDAGHLPSGTYFYRLQTASTMQTKQMTLVR